MNAAANAATAALPRSRFITTLAWVMIVGGAAVSPVSLISLLMVAAHSHGTSSSDPIGFATVVLGPPAAFVTGIGLLRRRWWAHRFTLALLGFTFASNVMSMFRVMADPRTYISPSGVPTTVLSSGLSYFLPAVVICAGLIWKLATPAIRAELARQP